MIEAVTPAQSFDHTAYKEQSRKAISLVNQLRDAGAQFQLELPCMVVCGNQSAGKSSLLERLCGVRLSTAAPTVAGATWYCQIKLRREYSKDNQQLDSAPKEQVFTTLNQCRKEYLHHYISAAQRALLNPDTSADIYVRSADLAAAAEEQDSGSTAAAGSSAASSKLAGLASASADELQFTRNVVVLEITGADVDLALIDLPGIIQTEQADNGSNVELVQQLVKHYISSTRAIIVATITCKDDIDNQLIVQLAREADKDGRRTIGVLTKADMIEPGTHHTWLPVLQGESYPLRLGYYVVINPSQQDLNSNMTAAEAAAKEAEFFKADAFFSSDPRLGRAARGRCGVDALRAQLSRQLVQLTQRELPGMKHALEQVLAEVTSQLQQLPPPPSSDSSLELFRRLRSLSESVRDAVQGRDDVAFFRAADSHYRLEFCHLDWLHIRAVGDILIGSSAASSGAASSGAAGTGAAGTASNGSSKELQEDSLEFWLEGAGAEQQQLQQPVGLITLERVRDLAQKFRTDELPDFFPFRVVQELVQGLKGRWDAAAQACLHDVAQELQELTGSLVQRHFGQFSRAEMHIRDLLYEALQQLVEDTRQRLEHLMAMEHEETWTQNDHYYADSMQRFLDMLTKRMYGSSSAAHDTTYQSSISQALSYLASAGIAISKEELELLPAKSKQRSEGQEGLLKLVAGTLAYFKVASKRVIDGVPMHLKHFLLQRYCRELDELLVKRAAADSSGGVGVSGRADGAVAEKAAAAGTWSGAGGAEYGEGMPQQQQQPTAEQLMAEDASTADLRAQLKRQLEQLHNVRRILERF
ncbi:P-loop containing nucleoside triphosphate hydrolase protein [Scenedesmus sp. NREL 46B-D3]|nr:P-loop containing nucleoside triphosphate hydrolase protein [Scenedesmus sp. NREL 46B-D3]